MIKNMHHVAYKCRDSEATRSFYEDLLGLPLSHVIKLDHVPSTGEYAPYVHLFFELQDGSCLAFFDIGDGKATELDPQTPPWLQHCAMEVGSIDELLDYKRKLEAAGVQVTGPTDHGFVKSIYFRDPNNLKMELTTRVFDSTTLAQYKRNARGILDSYTRGKAVSGTLQS